MEKTYRLLLAFGMAALSLSSCSRSTYSFNTTAPAYLGAQPVAATQPASQPKAAVEATPLATAAPAAAKASQLPVAKAPVARAAKPARATLLQRVLVKQVTKQLAKIKSKGQNTANTEQVASKTGRAAEIALAGLALILLGVAINGGFGAVLALIGYIAFLVGLVLVVVHLVSGD